MTSTAGIGGWRSKVEDVDSERAYSERWLIEEGFRRKTLRRGFSLDCSVDALEPKDSFRELLIPNPRPVGVDVVVPAPAVRACIRLGVLPCRGGSICDFSAGEVPTDRGRMEAARSSRWTANKGLDSLDLAKSEELKDGIFDVDDPGTASRAVRCFVLFPKLCAVPTS